MAWLGCQGHHQSSSHQMRSARSAPWCPSPWDPCTHSLGAQGYLGGCIWGSGMPIHQICLHTIAIFRLASLSSNSSPMRSPPMYWGWGNSKENTRPEPEEGVGLLAIAILTCPLEGKSQLFCAELEESDRLHSQAATNRWSSSPMGQLPVIFGEILASGT